MSDYENQGQEADPGSESTEAPGSQSASNASPNASSDSAASVDEVFEELTAGLDEVQSKEAELLADLQRLQAEFVNYKARVERDRDVARNNAIAEVLRSLFPALDDLARAEAHGDLEGSPFAAVANKLRAAGDKFGLKQFGEKGEGFNPELHDALVQTPSASVTEATIADVIEPGYQLGERVIRAAKVAVFVPAE